MTPTHLGSLEERSTATLRMTFRDETLAPVDPGTVSSVTLTLRDLRSGTKLRDAIETLSGGGGAVSAEGVYTFALTSADTAAVGTPAIQRRLVTLDITFTTGRRPHAVTFDVVNLTDIA